MTLLWIGPIIGTTHITIVGTEQEKRSVRNSRYHNLRPHHSVECSCHQSYGPRSCSATSGDRVSRGPGTPIPGEGERKNVDGLWFSGVYLVSPPVLPYLIHGAAVVTLLLRLGVQL